MKRFLCLSLVCCFVGSLLLVSGCGSSGGGVGAILGAAAFILAVTASGGTAGPSVVSFAASVRPNTQASVLAAARTFTLATDSLKVRVTPLVNGAPQPGAKEFTPIINPADGSQIIAECNLTGAGDYRVEIIGGASGTTLLKGVTTVSANVQEGATVPSAVNPDSTAKALTYEKWVDSGAGKSFTTFEHNLDEWATASAALTALSDEIVQKLDLNGVDVNLKGDPAITALVTAAASEVGTDDPPEPLTPPAATTDDIMLPQTHIKHAIHLVRAHPEEREFSEEGPSVTYRNAGSPESESLKLTLLELCKCPTSGQYTATVALSGVVDGGSVIFEYSRIDNIPQGFYYPPEAQLPKLFKLENGFITYDGGTPFPLD